MAKTRARLGANICLAIKNGKSIDDIKTLLDEAGSVDDEEITSIKGRPLWWALDCQNLECVKLLLEHVANPNYAQLYGGVPVSHYLEKVAATADGSFAKKAAILLLKHGSHIPSVVYRSKVPVCLAIREYIERPWTPANHLDWPIAFKRQVVALLCSLRVCRGIRVPSASVICFMIRVMGANHFVVL